MYLKKTSEMSAPEPNPQKRKPRIQRLSQFPKRKPETSAPERILKTFRTRAESFALFLAHKKGGSSLLKAESLKIQRMLFAWRFFF